MSYTINKKKRLARRINELRSIDEKTAIYNIIVDNENIDTRESNNKVLMLFNKLSDTTYKKIDKYINKLDKIKAGDSTNTINTDDYIPYVNDEFPSQKDFSPKLKYSNKERTLIKRKRFDEKLAEENGTDIEYQEFNITASESDMVTSDKRNSSDHVVLESNTTDDIINGKKPKAKKKSKN